MGGCPGAAEVGLPDQGLAVVGGVCVGGGRAQLRCWGEALHAAGFPLQGPAGGSGRRGEWGQAGEQARNGALPLCPPVVSGLALLLGN